MRYVEAPNVWTRERNERAIFLAGGITGCPDWQAEIADLFRTHDVTLLNPRRADFPIGDPAAARQQIQWEHDHLRAADAILFWFPAETLCPIVLYELGAWSMTGKPLFVGIHLDYQRRQDVEIQTTLVRPDVWIQYSLARVALQVSRWLGAAPQQQEPRGEESHA